jgi:hypothetical protein
MARLEEIGMRSNDTVLRRRPIPNKEGDQAWLHERITLESINPDYAPWDVASSENVNVIGEFVFTVSDTGNQSQPRTKL